ncbi:MAG: hypothetical protein ABSC04_02225 [Syntrophobacteraceae bacterium]
MDHEREPDTTSTMALPPSLEVRPITREQRSRWDRVMRQHHYLWGLIAWWVKLFAMLLSITTSGLL